VPTQPLCAESVDAPDAAAVSIVDCSREKDLFRRHHRAYWRARSTRGSFYIARWGAQISDVLVDSGDVVNFGQALALLIPLGGSQTGSSIARRRSEPRGGNSYLAGYGFRRTAGTDRAAVACCRRDRSYCGESKRSNLPRVEPLFQIIVRGELDLVAQVDSGRLGKVAPGMEARLKIAGIEGAGKVGFVNAIVDPLTQLAQVRIQQLEPDERLRSRGCSAAPRLSLNATTAVSRFRFLPCSTAPAASPSCRRSAPIKS
jgi:hypothetical protein